MRIVFIGGNKVSKIAVKQLTESGNEVIIIDSNKERIDELSESLDCGFIYGDGTRPDILKEVDPKKTDILICGTNDDHANIIATLLAKALEFPKVITMISNVELETVCINLGIDAPIFSAKTIGDYLQELVNGRDVFEMVQAVRNDLRLFSFKARKAHKKKVYEFSLPKQTQVVWVFRKDTFFFPSSDTEIEEGDWVVIGAASGEMKSLHEQFSASNN